MKIWFRGNTVVYHIRQSKIDPDLKRNDTEWKEHTNPLLTVNYGPKYNLWCRKAKPFTAGTSGLFAGKARCMNCGYTIRSNKQTDGRYSLQCSNRHVAKDACIDSFISVKKLGQPVITELNQLSQEYLDVDELEQNVKFCSNVKEKKTSLEIQLTAYQKNVRRRKGNPRTLS